MSQPETPAIDPLAQYHALLEERSTLMAVEPANPSVADLYAKAAHRLDQQIAQIEGPLVDTTMTEVTTSLTALEQLNKLSRLSVADALQTEIQAQEAEHMARVAKAATFLTEHFAENPLVQLLVDTARAAGILTVDAVDQEEGAVEDTVAEPLLQEPLLTEEAQASTTVSEQVTDALDEAMLTRLHAYANRMQPGQAVDLKPWELRDILAIDATYRGSDRRMLVRLMETLDPESDISLTHNGRPGRAAQYTLVRRKVVSVIEVSMPDGESGEFDIDQYFSNEDGLLLAAFLYKFNGFLEENGIAPIQTDVIAPLLESVPEQPGSQNDADMLREMRAQSVAKIGALFDNPQLLEQAIDCIEESDPRHPLFDYLFDILDEATHATLRDLLDAQKEQIVAIDTQRQGTHVVGVDGIVRLPAGSTLEQMRYALRSEHSDVARLASIATEATDDEGEAILQPPRSTTPTAPSASQVPEKRQKAADPRLVRCKQLAGELLNRMQAGGVDFSSTELSVASLRPYLGNNVTRVVGDARKKDLLARRGAGNNNSRRGLSVVDAVMASLGQSDRAVQAYVATNTKKVRGIVQNAVDKIVNAGSK